MKDLEKLGLYVYAAGNPLANVDALGLQETEAERKARTSGDAIFISVIACASAQASSS